jgi:selenocysteine-specific elongation factor
MKALASSSGALSVIGWSPKLSGADAVLAESVLKVLDQAGHEPPSAEELALQLGASPEGILRFLERRGDIVQVEAGRYYTSAHLKSLIDRLRGVLSGGAEANPSQIRDGLGLSRKYLIPFLEYCDRVGYTNRHAGGRVWKGT